MNHVASWLFQYSGSCYVVLVLAFLFVGMVEWPFGCCCFSVLDIFVCLCVGLVVSLFDCLFVGLSVSLLVSSFVGMFPISFLLVCVCLSVRTRAHVY